MIQVTLTAHNGDQRELRLPLHAEDAVKPHLGSFLAYGTASVKFEMLSQNLRDLLSQTIPKKMDGGIDKLNIMANVLKHMNGQQLQRLEKNLAENDCDFTEAMRQVLYYGCHAFGKNAIPNPDAVPIEQYKPDIDLLHMADKVHRQFEKELEAQRMTGGQLFSKIIDQARANGDMEHFDAIAEYVLPEDYENGKLCRYEFDLMPVVNFGGSEGIYVDCYLKGAFDESGKNSLHIGTIKTLSDDLDACKTMGELCGILLYHDSKYVNENLTRFDSLEAIERMLEQPIKMEVEQEQANSLTQQMI